MPWKYYPGEWLRGRSPEQLAAPGVVWWNPSKSLLHEHSLPPLSESGLVGRKTHMCTLASFFWNKDFSSATSPHLLLVKNFVTAVISSTHLSIQTLPFSLLGKLRRSKFIFYSQSREDFHLKTCGVFPFWKLRRLGWWESPHDLSVLKIRLL